MNNNTYIIAITGGSGSGKTFLCDKLTEQFGEDRILKIEVDSYYKNLAHLKMEEREKNNFDHPDAFEFDLLSEDLNKMKNSKRISIPLYNYKTNIHSYKL